MTQATVAEKTRSAPWNRLPAKTGGHRLKFYLHEVCRLIMIFLIYELTGHFKGTERLFLLTIGTVEGRRQNS